MKKPMNGFAFVQNPSLKLRKPAAFTLVELLVVIGIIALLISILLPALSKARGQATLVACAAQFRDLGSAIQMYAHDNTGYFPGPMLAQVRAGYHNNDYTLGWYLHKYLRLPDPSTTPGLPGYDATTPIRARSLLCPGYAANNQISAAGTEWTYMAGGWDPYPWFGYSNNAANQFPIRVSIAGAIMVEGKAMTAPMKLSQMFSGSEMPLITEIDRAEMVYEGSIASTLSTDIAPVPSHGGKAENRQGVQGIAVQFGSTMNGNCPYYQVIDKSAATNPARNALFGDFHVGSSKRSGPFVPSDLRRYGKPPFGIKILGN